MARHSGFDHRGADVLAASTDEVGGATGYSEDAVVVDAGDIAREVSSDEVKDLRREAGQLKEAMAELMMENRLLNKSVLGDRGDDI